jgi:serine/threonine-protein kinase RsbW
MEPMETPNLDPIVVRGESEELGNALSAIRAYVVQASKLAGLEKDSMSRLRLAVDEISANIIMYGYVGNGLTGTVKASATIDENALTIILEDNAPPYDPRKKDPPRDLDNPLDTREIGGLGIFLALKNIDKFDYERLDNRNINRFSVKRKREQLINDA